MVSIQHIPTNNPESKNPDFFCQENVFTRVFFKKIVYLNTNSEFVDRESSYDFKNIGLENLSL